MVDPAALAGSRASRESEQPPRTFPNVLGGFHLLADPIYTVFAVNCHIEGGQLRCGALYMEPLIQERVVTLSSEQVRMRVELPAQSLHRPVPTYGWDVELLIVGEPLPPAAA